jgi:hypothetical protein
MSRSKLCENEPEIFGKKITVTHRIPDGSPIYMQCLTLFSNKELKFLKFLFC